MDFANRIKENEILGFTFEILGLAEFLKNQNFCLVESSVKFSLSKPGDS